MAPRFWKKEKEPEQVKSIPVPEPEYDTSIPEPRSSHPISKPIQQEQKVIGVPVCVSIEEMFNLINKKLDYIISKIDES